MGNRQTCLDLYQPITANQQHKFEHLKTTNPDMFSIDELYHLAHIFINSANLNNLTIMPEKTSLINNQISPLAGHNG